MNIEGLRLSGDFKKPIITKPAPRKLLARRFVPNMPLELISKAAVLHGKALNLILALWYRTGLEKSDTVILSGATLKQFGVSRQCYYRICRQLMQQGFIRVDKRRGACARITLLARVSTPNEASHD